MIKLDTAVWKMSEYGQKLAVIGKLCVDAAPYVKREIQLRTFPKTQGLEVGELYYYEPRFNDWDPGTHVEVVEFQGMRIRPADGRNMPVYKTCTLEAGACVMFLGYIPKRCELDPIECQVEVLHKEKIYILGFASNVFSTRYKLADDVLIPVARKT